MRLSSLPRHKTAIISGIRTPNTDLHDGLTEQGLVEGTSVEILQRGMIGGTPLAVRVGRSVLALRRSEADAVEVVLP